MAKGYAKETPTLPQNTMNAISTAVANGISAGLSSDKSKAMNPTEQRKVEYVSGLKKEAALARALTTEAGLRKIAANMANPVRFYLDYRGIFRKFAVVEQIPDGVPMIYDRDFPDVPAVKVGVHGSASMIEMIAQRVELEPFEIMARPKVPYRELFNRRFRALDRAKDKLIMGMELREDLIGFSLLATAWAAGGNAGVTVAGALTKAALADAFAQIERWRLPVAQVLMSAYGTRDIRSWEWTVLDQLALQEIRETGYLGNLWGADFYVSDQVANGTMYIMTTPKFLAWMPFRRDTQVIPADDPDNAWLGFVGYELLGMTVFNSNGVTRLTFTV